MAPLKNKKNIVTNTFEQVTDVGKKSVTGTAHEVSKTFFSDFLGLTDNEPTTHQKEVQKEIKEKTEDEQKKLGENFTPLDSDRIQTEVQKLEEARKHLFDLVKSDEAKAIEARREEARQKEQEERELEQQKQRQLEQQQAANQQDSLPQGKQKGKLGQARKKATTAPPQNFENKSNKGK